MTARFAKRLLSCVVCVSALSLLTPPTITAQDALDRLGEKDPNLVLVFSSVAYDQEKMLAGVHSVVKGALIVGCSTAGEITTDGPAKRHSVTPSGERVPRFEPLALTMKVSREIRADVLPSPRIASLRSSRPSACDSPSNWA